VGCREIIEDSGEILQRIGTEVLDPSLRAPLTLARDDGRVLLATSKTKAEGRITASLHDCRAYTPRRWPFYRCPYLTAPSPGDAR
jgi:hypothetical protein